MKCDRFKCENELQTPPQYKYGVIRKLTTTFNESGIRLVNEHKICLDCLEEYEKLLENESSATIETFLKG